MDNDVEARLREALRLHAVASPAGASMLSAVRGITVRRRRRRQTGWAAALVVLVVLAASAVPGLLKHPQPFASPPAIVHSVLIGGGPLTVEVPYSLSGATAVIAAGHPTLRDKGFEIWTTSVVPTGGSPRPVTVREKPGTLLQQTDRQVLFWSETPGQWLVVAGDASGDVTDLRTIAGALRRTPSTGAVPFTFALVPEGYTVDNIDAAVVTFCPPGVPPSEGFVGKIAVRLDAPTTDTTPAPLATGTEALPVGGRRAVLHQDSDGLTLSVRQDDGRTLVVQDTMATHLSRQDLIDLAAGIGVTAAAAVSQG